MCDGMSKGSQWRVWQGQDHRQRTRSSPVNFPFRAAIAYLANGAARQYLRLRQIVTVMCKNFVSVMVSSVHAKYSHYGQRLDRSGWHGCM